MILYLDTSAWVKLYAVEAGSERVRQAVDSATLVATHLIAYVELRSALGRKHRLGETTEAAHWAALHHADIDWERLHRLSLDEALVRRAGEFADLHGLRAYDAVHLAAAETLRNALGMPVHFACFDAHLAAVAGTMGIEGLEL